MATLLSLNSMSIRRMAASSMPRSIHQQPTTTSQIGGHGNCASRFSSSITLVSSSASKWKLDLYFGLASPRSTDRSHFVMCAKTSSAGCILRTAKCSCLALDV